MYATTLEDHVRAYLNLQAFLDECRADGKNAEAALRSVEEARRALLRAVKGSSRPGGDPLAEAIRSYLDAEDQFDASTAAGTDLDAPARRMESSRRELERQLHAASGKAVCEARVVRASTHAPATSRHQRRVLVAYDESAPAQYALEVAVKLAEDAGGILMLLHVVRPATGAGGEYVSSLERIDILHHREADEWLTRVRHNLSLTVTSDQMVREGLAPDEIITAAKDWNADLIVIGTRARGRLTQFLLGSTAEAVIRRAPCPVTAVGRKAAWADEERQQSEQSDDRIAAIAAP